MIEKVQKALEKLEVEHVMQPKGEGKAKFMTYVNGKKYVLNVRVDSTEEMADSYIALIDSMVEKPKKKKAAKKKAEKKEEVAEEAAE